MFFVCFFVSEKEYNFMNNDVHYTITLEINKNKRRLVNKKTRQEKREEKMILIYGRLKKIS